MAVGHRVEGVCRRFDGLVEVICIEDGFCINDAFHDVSQDAVPSFDQTHPPVSFSGDELKPDAVPLGVLLEVEAVVGAWVTPDGDRETKRLKP